MRNLIDLVEDGFELYREQDYGDEINRLLMDARALQSKLQVLNVAPTMQERLDSSMGTVVTYLGNLADHVSANLNPRLGRRRR